MSHPGDSRRILHPVSARSPKGLTRLMLKIQVQDGMQYKWTDPVFAQGKWWSFYHRIADVKSMTERGAADGSS